MIQRLLLMHLKSNVCVLQTYHILLANFVSLAICRDIGMSLQEDAKVVMKMRTLTLLKKHV